MTKIPIIGVVTPIILNNKKIGVIQVFRDVTPDIQINKAKDEFLSIASHELRTPLSAIDGLISMILDGEYGEISDNLKLPLKDVNESSERLVHLVNDLLSVSRIQAGRLKFNLSEFFLNDNLKQIITMLEILAQKKQITLKLTDFDDVSVQADKDKLTEIMNNIVGNSIKFTDNGGITISAKQVGERVEISVTDTGIGISHEDQAKLFGKFEQIQLKGNKPVGTGLGLYISKAIAQKMGGDVWLFESTPGKGSTFKFSIPVAKSTIAQQTKEEIDKEDIALPKI